MRPVVLDASVLAKLYFPEELSDRAEAEIRAAASTHEGGRLLHAPDLIHLELASVVWKRERGGQIRSDEARETLAEATRLPVVLHSVRDYLSRALDLALETGCTVYDATYLSLAIVLDGVLLTADQRLTRKLAGGPLEQSVRWIGAEPD